MLYKDGQLIVPQSREYHIYTELYYLNNKRVMVVAKHKGQDKSVAMISPPSDGGEYSQGQLYTGGVFELKKYDTIKLQVRANGKEA